MNHFYVITNYIKDPDRVITNRIRTFLEEHGRQCAFQEQDAELTIPAETDCILVLGGDGTILQAVRDTIELQIPVIGVNLGTLGFLAEIEQENLEESLEQLLNGDYELEKRMMLTGKVVKEDTPFEEGYALNDIVISRKGSLQIIKFNIYVNGMFLKTFHADGVIVATPTGSTGYNLSAGGPIVEPKAQLILITPICPHTTNTRPVILSPEDLVTIEIAPGKYGEEQVVEANFDGSHRVTMYTGDKIDIVRAEKPTEIVKLSQVSFLQILHKKLS